MFIAKKRMEIFSKFAFLALAIIAVALANKFDGDSRCKDKFRRCKPKTPAPTPTTSTPTSTTPTSTTSTTPATLPSCASGQYRCLNSSVCINRTSICDHHKDCALGDDENRCACPTGTIACNDNETCVAAKKICDGVVDCPGGGDEIGPNCNCKLTNTLCAPLNFLGVSTVISLPGNFISVSITISPASCGILCLNTAGCIGVLINFGNIGFPSFVVGGNCALLNAPFSLGSVGWNALVPCTPATPAQLLIC